MILLHHKESELSRNLLATMPAGTTVVDCTNGIPTDYTGPMGVSAFPSVVVTIPANEFQTPVYGVDGELLGVEWTAYDEYEEALRMPISWEAVAEYVALKTPPPPPEEVPAEGEGA